MSEKKEKEKAVPPTPTPTPTPTKKPKIEIEKIGETPHMLVFRALGLVIRVPKNPDNIPNRSIRIGTEDVTAEIKAEIKKFIKKEKEAK